MSPQQVRLLAINKQNVGKEAQHLTNVRDKDKDKDKDKDSDRDK